MIGIIGALPEEIEQLLDAMTDTVTLSEGGFTLYQGRLEGKEVLLSQCGIGKVNAAMVTQLLLSHGAELIIFTGVAGGVDERLKVGDIVVSNDTVQHDVDVTGLGLERGQFPDEPVFWVADERLRQLAVQKAREQLDVMVLEGRVASGDQFIASPERVAWLRETFNAACVEMEGASVARVCAKWQTPFVIIRSISDTADDAAGGDYREFTPLAANRAKQVVRAMLKDL